MARLGLLILIGIGAFVVWRLTTPTNIGLGITTTPLNLFKGLINANNNPSSLGTLNFN